jgi:hypothetical protein
MPLNHLTPLSLNNRIRCHLITGAIVRSNITSYNTSKFKRGVYMIIISNYAKEHRDNKVFIRSKEDSVCPICSSNLKTIGSKQRKVIEQDGSKQTYVIRRLRCIKCKTIHHELPDLIVPYKRHCLSTIELAISTKQGSSLITSSSTTASYTIRKIKTWWNVVSVYLMNIINSLKFKYGAVYFNNPCPRDVVRAVVNTHNWVHTRSVQMSMRC